MIAELRRRGRLVEMIPASPERAIAEMEARHAVNDMEPSADEMRWMLSFLAGSCPRAVYEAAFACRNVYRIGVAVGPAGSAHGAPDFRE